MNLVKKLGLTIAGLVFCMGLFAATSNAQYRGYGYGSGYGTQYGWYGGGRINRNEARRLQRQRQRIYNQRNRAYRDGYVNPRERRRLQRSYYRYQRNVWRDRRDW